MQLIENRVKKKHSLPALRTALFAWKSRLQVLRPSHASHELSSPEMEAQPHPTCCKGKSTDQAQQMSLHCTCVCVLDSQVRLLGNLPTI